MWENTSKLYLASLALVFLTSCSNVHQKTLDYYSFSYYPSETEKKQFKQGEGSMAMHRATLKPYTVFNVRYSPHVEDIGYTQNGIASWYGPDFHGKLTSCGEIYDMHAMTAAHKTLPMHTIVEVTHKKTNKSIRVRVNDRGPFVKGRIIDLSFEAGKALGLDKTGIAPVSLSVIAYDTYITQNFISNNDMPLFSNKTSKPNKNFGVQIGAFKNKDNANSLKDKAHEAYNKPTSLQPTYVNGIKIYRVIIDDFSTQHGAKKFIEEHNLQAKIIKKDN